MGDETQALNLWPIKFREEIKQKMAQFSRESPFAVFDADNTIWRGDITETMLVWLENKEKIKLHDLPEERLCGPTHPGESAYEYYMRMCSTGEEEAYKWIAQIFAGFTLKELKDELHEMLEEKELHSKGRKAHVLDTPVIYPAQAQLIRYLQNSGVKVWVVSASPEELVRFMLCHPEKGVDIPPERIIGVNLKMKGHSGRTFDSAESREKGHAYRDYFDPERLSATQTDQVLEPYTWFRGKVSAIKKWIDPKARPVLVAGDSPNDFPMQFYSRGLRIRIARNPAHGMALEELREGGSILIPKGDDPRRDWIEIKAEALGL